MKDSPFDPSQPPAGPTPQQRRTTLIALMLVLLPPPCRASWPK